VQLAVIGSCHRGWPRGSGNQTSSLFGLSFPALGFPAGSVPGTGMMQNRFVAKSRCIPPQHFSAAFCHNILLLHFACGIFLLHFAAYLQSALLPSMDIWLPGIIGLAFPDHRFPVRSKLGFCYARIKASLTLRKPHAALRALLQKIICSNWSILGVKISRRSLRSISIGVSKEEIEGKSQASGKCLSAILASRQTMQNSMSGWFATPFL
jgi:hypothetical protein